MSEILNLVDKHDKKIGETARCDAHADGLWHQRATIFVFNKDNELLIQQRAKKMSWPGLWCGSASGHVLAGETYEQAAQRELKEEIGIDCDLKYVGKLKEETHQKTQHIDVDREHHKLFVCHSDGPFNIQQSELSKVKFIPLKKLEKKIKKNPKKFMPGFLAEFEYYISRVNR